LNILSSLVAVAVASATVVAAVQEVIEPIQQH
jgi:hypothetical protein